MLPSMRQARETTKGPPSARKAAATAPHLWCSRPYQQDVPEIWVSAMSTLLRAYMAPPSPTAWHSVCTEGWSLMRLSTYARGRESWTARVAIAAMAVLVVAIGCCVFDGHDHDGVGDHASLDLCLGMAVVPLPIVVTGELPMAGLIAAYQVAHVLSFSPHVPAPPPKLLS
jgi:hypothetical protein